MAREQATRATSATSASTGPVMDSARPCVLTIGYMNLVLPAAAAVAVFRAINSQGFEFADTKYENSRNWFVPRKDNVDVQLRALSDVEMARFELARGEE